MKLIKADHARRITIPGVPRPVQRPVDIDKAKTGFSNLRSLRIYRFEPETVIEGHAEEDEVFVVVLEGSIEFLVSGDSSGVESHRFTLSAMLDSQADGCVAYMPPHSAYRLTPIATAEVAYARATPPDGPPAAAFKIGGEIRSAGNMVLLEELSYARRLRLRLTAAMTDDIPLACEPPALSEADCEALWHVRTVPDEGVATIMDIPGSSRAIESWDTAVLEPGDSPSIQIAPVCTALILAVWAV